MFEHRNLSNNLFFHVLLDFDKTLKIDLFERCISENFPIAYDGMRMKLINFELLISKTLTFFHTCWSVSMLSINVQDLGLGHPPPSL